MSFSFLDALQGMESIVAHALLRAASALMPTPASQLAEHWALSPANLFLHAIFKTRFTADVTACQRDSSAASCFLPPAVSA